MSDQNKIPTEKLVTGIIGWVLIFVFFFWLFGAFDTGSTTSSSTDGLSDRHVANYCIKEKVKGYLSFPNTAKFKHTYIDVEAEGSDRYFLESFVDSENAFGQTISTY